MIISVQKLDIRSVIDTGDMLAQLPASICLGLVIAEIHVMKKQAFER